VRWEHLTDVDANGKSATLPHLKGLKNGDIATSRIKQVCGDERACSGFGMCLVGVLICGLLCVFSWRAQAWLGQAWSATRPS